MPKETLNVVGIGFRKGDDKFREAFNAALAKVMANPATCLLYTSPSPRDGLLSRMPSSA